MKQADSDVSRLRGATVGASHSRSSRPLVDEAGKLAIKRANFKRLAAKGLIRVAPMPSRVSALIFLFFGEHADHTGETKFDQESLARTAIQCP